MTEPQIEEVDHGESAPATKARSRQLSARGKRNETKKAKKEEDAEGEGDAVVIQDQSVSKKKKGAKRGNSRVVRRPSVMRPAGGWM